MRVTCIEGDVHEAHMEMRVTCIEAQVGEQHKE